MNYEEMCKRIQMQIHYCWSKFGIRPNRIILGKNTFDFIKANNPVVCKMDYASGEAEAFGIKVVVNHDNPHEISVGYVEEINL